MCSRKDHLLLTKDYFDTVLALTVPGHLITVSNDSKSKDNRMGFKTLVKIVTHNLLTTC